MTVNELIESIKKHDWDYSQSDDLRVFERGIASEAAIMRQLANVKLEDLEPHFDEYVNRKLKALYVRSKY